jgi:hypothetical protein
MGRLPGKHPSFCHYTENPDRRLVVPIFLLCCAAIPLLAQQAGNGSISGKLTDIYSRPLPGIAITLKNTRSGLEFHTVTERSGAYRIAGLTPGDYSLEAESLRFGYGKLQGILISAGHEARVQAAVTFAPKSIESVVALTNQPNPAKDWRSTEMEADANDTRIDAADAGSPTFVSHSSPPPLIRFDMASSLSTEPLQRLDLSAEIAVPPREPDGAMPNGLAQPPETGIQRKPVMLAVASEMAHRQTGFALAAICGLQARLQAGWPVQRNIELATGAAA